MKERGYFGIGVINPKFDENLGSLWRSANVFNASFIYTIDRKYKRSNYADTMSTPKHIPLYEYENFETFMSHIPEGCVLVAVENSENSQLLPGFTHPDRCIYLLGSENKGIPDEILAKCERIVRIPGSTSLNVSIAGSIIMYDRLAKKKQDANPDDLSASEINRKKLIFIREYNSESEKIKYEVAVSSGSLKVKLMDTFTDFEGTALTLPYFTIKQKKYLENELLTQYGIDKAESLVHKLVVIGKYALEKNVVLRGIIDEYYSRIHDVNSSDNYLNNINFTKAKIEIKNRLENKEINQNDYQNRFLREINIRHQEYLDILGKIHEDYNKKLEKEINVNASGIDIIKCMKKYFKID